MLLAYGEGAFDELRRRLALLTKGRPADTRVPIGQGAQFAGAGACLHQVRAVVGEVSQEQAGQDLPVPGVQLSVVLSAVGEDEVASEDGVEEELGEDADQLRAARCWLIVQGGNSGVHDRCEELPASSLQLTCFALRTFLDSLHNAVQALTLSPYRPPGFSFARRTFGTASSTDRA